MSLSTVLRKFIGRCLSLVFVHLATSLILAQEALHTSISGEEAAAAKRRALENQSGSIRIGNASFIVGGSVGLEYNDNVNYSDIGQQKDFIVRPAMSLSAMLPFTEANAIYGNLDIGYAKFLRYSQYDRLTLRPGSQLGFDVYVKNFHFNLHDDIAITEEPVAQGTISGTGKYGEFSNTGGIGIDWDLNDVIASFGYDHQNTISTESHFSYLDRAAENFFGRAEFQVSQSLSLGPEASGGLTDYEQHVLNDSLNYSFGAFASWQMSQYITLKPRFGYVGYTFANSGSGTNQTKIADVNSYYVSLEISHRLNEYVTYHVDGGRQIRLGVNSELITLWYTRASIDWNLVEHLGLGTHLTFEQGTDSGSAIFLTPENYTLLGGGLGMQYPLMEKLLLALEYEYLVKDSNIPARNYHQHKVQLRLQYTF